MRRTGLEVIPLGKADPMMPMLLARFRVLRVEQGTYADLPELSLREPCTIRRDGLLTFCTSWTRQVLGSAGSASGMLAALDGALHDFEEDLRTARK